LTIVSSISSIASVGSITDSLWARIASGLGA
jgi:hypothetical protein